MRFIFQKLFLYSTHYHWLCIVPFKNPYIEKVLLNTHILIDPDEMYIQKGKWNSYFWNLYPLILEIGTGMGNFFASQIEENPKKNFIGMELKRKRLDSTAKKSHQSWNENFILLKDLGQNISKIFEEKELEKTYIYFPDPWTKKPNQKKNQLLSTKFLCELYTVTQESGYLEIKTDDWAYYDIIWGNLKKTPWKIVEMSTDYEKESLRFSIKNLTEFEAMWRGKKKQVGFILLQK